MSFIKNPLSASPKVMPEERILAIDVVIAEQTYIPSSLAAEMMEEINNLRELIHDTVSLANNAIGTAMEVDPMDAGVPTDNTQAELPFERRAGL